MTEMTCVLYALSRHAFIGLMLSQSREAVGDVLYVQLLFTKDTEAWPDSRREVQICLLAFLNNLED